MKTFTITIVLALIATFSFAQFPQSTSPDSSCYDSQNLRAAIYKSSPSQVSVKVAKALGEKIKIRVKEDHKVLFTQNYKRWALVDVQYDISQFPKGEYTFEIIQNKEVVFSQIINTESTEESLSLR
jgi:hypothetical protein